MKTPTTGWLLVIALLFSGWSPSASAQSEEPEVVLTPMTDTRLLRRMYLTLLGRGPTIDEYEALLAHPAEERRAEIEAQAATALDSPEFAEQARLWGNDYMGVPGYFGASNRHTYQFDGAISPALRPCPDGSLHTGRLGLFRNDDSTNVRYGQSYSLCEDPAAPVAETEPWWAPGTTVATIGDVATENRVSVEGDDCAAMRSSFRSGEGCGCGPNLIYCTQRPIGEEGDYYIAGSMRRQVHEEPARLFSHIVMQDRPFTDLVLGNYTVATRTLRMAYMRQARMTPENAFMDDTNWWRDYASEPDRWREVPIHEIHPQLLEERAYSFDPRTEAGRPRGIPAAGVLTTIVANQAWPRERVRGAAWIRAFACREFAPPASDVEFPPYERDPGREGPCLACHQLIDPAAMYFKRPFDVGGLIAGTTSTWSIDGRVTGATYRLNGHANGSMIPDTLMTPVTQDMLDDNSDARFIDFMPPGTRLFGQQGTGTIGPLGFGEVLVSSGEFDRCAVRRTYERYGGRDLLPGQDDVLLDRLVATFLEENRNMRALIRAVVASEEFGLGL